MVSPNPASEKIMVSLAEPSSISQIDLVNISGQVLQSTQTIRFINFFEISHLQAGIYYLRISGKNGLSTTSFIKQ
ncbi:MAG: T9SS type A sorting domain-containing protein [Chitinophagaceae bacterium]|nr:T9SS type A sorting domain-containing protein [Chitinophagaceae bacterium]